MPKHLSIPLLFSLSGLLGIAQEAQLKKFNVSAKSGISMGRWVYDKGLSELDGGFHQGYDRSHLAVYIPLGVEVTYQWKKWGVGVAANLGWLSDDELISSTSKPLVPREYFLTDGSAISFTTLNLMLGRTLIDLPRYKLQARMYFGTFQSQQDHPRKDFFGRHYLLDFGLDNEISLNKQWFILLRPIFKRKFIGTRNSPFPGESHEIITFGLDYGFGVYLF